MHASLRNYSANYIKPHSHSSWLQAPRNINIARNDPESQILLSDWTSCRTTNTTGFALGFILLHCWGAGLETQSNIQGVSELQLSIFSVVQSFTEASIQEADKRNWSSKNHTFQAFILIFKGWMWTFPSLIQKAPKQWSSILPDGTLRLTDSGSVFGLPWIVSCRHTALAVAFENIPVIRAYRTLTVAQPNQIVSNSSALICELLYGITQISVLILKCYFI